jgi:hypothetical protein
MNGSTYTGSWTTGTGLGGWTCGCGAWVAYGQSHVCPSFHPQAGYTCGGCGQYVYGYHTCTGSGFWQWTPHAPSSDTQTFTSPVEAETEPEPPVRPDSPVAALVNDLCELLGKAVSWLSERRI